jgi:phosphopantothenoylcysteine decarboxylase/phosphopantothenate--cysteine ligase
MPDQSAAPCVLVGVTGSIAAYKACGLVRRLRADRLRVRVVMTPSAQQFVTPTTFRALSGMPVVTDMFVAEGGACLEHISLAEWADVLCVAPATANFIGKVAGGLADEILCCTWMACDCPKVIAPAMNDRMWASAAVQRNVAWLGEQPGVALVGPVEGTLASGKTAMGHLAPLGELVDAVRRALDQPKTVAPPEPEPR